MSSINKVFIMGRLGQDPKSMTFDGKKIVSFSVATQDVYKGNKTTEWHNIVSYGNNAEICEKYLKKGSLVWIDGKIKYKTFKDKSGNTKSSVSIQSQSIKFIGPKNTDSQSECYNNNTDCNPKENGGSNDFFESNDPIEEFEIPF